MKIKKVLHQKDSSTTFNAITDNNTMISVSMYRHSFTIQVFPQYNHFHLYEDDPDFEEVSIHTFNRALRVVRNTIENNISKL